MHFSLAEQQLPGRACHQSSQTSAPAMGRAVGTLRRNRGTHRLSGNATAADRQSGPAQRLARPDELRLRKSCTPFNGRSWVNLPRVCRAGVEGPPAAFEERHSRVVTQGPCTAPHSRVHHERSGLSCGGSASATEAGLFIAASRCRSPQPAASASTRRQAPAQRHQADHDVEELFRSLVARVGAFASFDGSLILGMRGRTPPIRAPALALLCRNRIVLAARWLPLGGCSRTQPGAFRSRHGISRRCFAYDTSLGRLANVGHESDMEVHKAKQVSNLRC